MKKSKFNLIILFASILSLLGCEKTDFEVISANIPAASTMQIQTYNNLTRMSFGIKAVDPTNASPTVKCYESKQWFNGSEWCLYAPSKQNIVGVFNRYGTEDEDNGGFEIFKDFKDWNFIINCFEEYQGFYNSVAATNPTKKDWVIGCISPDDVCGVDAYNNEKCLGTEVAPYQAFLNNNQWFSVTDDHCQEGTFLKKEDTLGVFGCFITDEYHGGQPEIHPIQQMWYRNRSETTQKKEVFWLMFLQDASTRFDNWIASPLHGQFLIAFKVKDPGLHYSTTNPLTMNLEIAYKSDLVTNQFSAMRSDCDNGYTHKLVIDDKTLLVVNEPSNTSDDNNIGVKFIDLAKLDDGSIIGFVQVSLVIGDKGTDEFGVCVLSLEVSQPTSKIVNQNQGDVPIKQGNQQ